MEVGVCGYPQVLKKSRVGLTSLVFRMNVDMAVIHSQLPPQNSFEEPPWLYKLTSLCVIAVIHHPTNFVEKPNESEVCPIRAKAVVVWTHKSNALSFIPGQTHATTQNVPSPCPYCYCTLLD